MRASELFSWISLLQSKSFLNIGLQAGGILVLSLNHELFEQRSNILRRSSLFFRSLNLFVCSFLFFGFEPSSAMTEKEARSILDNASVEIIQGLSESPDIYDFRNSDGMSSVIFDDVVFEQILISDIKTKIYEVSYGSHPGQGQLGADGILSLFQYGEPLVSTSPYIVNPNSSIQISLKSLSEEFFDFYDGKETYKDYQSSKINLKNRLSGKVNSIFDGAQSQKLSSTNLTVLGWSTPEVMGVKFDSNNDGQLSSLELVYGLISIVGKNAAGNQEFFEFGNDSTGKEKEKIFSAAVTKDGLDIAQFMQKFFHGAIALAQFADITAHFLQNPLDSLKADENTPMVYRSGDVAPYTSLEYIWDQGFAYFGAAKDYSQYSLDDIAGGYSKDSFAESDEEIYGEVPLIYGGEDYGDGFIALGYEKNLGMAVNAAKRDLGSGEVSNFKHQIGTSFIKGRAILASKDMNLEKHKMIQAYSVVALSQWEKLMAANTIHYINKTILDYEKYEKGQFKFHDLAKHFSEMKGFAMAFQFNPLSPLSKDLFVKIHRLMGDHPYVPQGSQEQIKQRSQKYIDNLKDVRDRLSKAMGFTADNGYTDEVLENW